MNTNVFIPVFLAVLWNYLCCYKVVHAFAIHRSLLDDGHHQQQHFYRSSATTVDGGSLTSSSRTTKRRQQRHAASPFKNEESGDFSTTSSSLVESESSSFIPGSFNPFQYDAKQGLPSAQPISTATTVATAVQQQQQQQQSRGQQRRTSVTDNVISWRQTQMSQLMNTLLSAEPFTVDQLRSILQQHQEFILEPIIDDTAVLDRDSIYQHCTNQQERYNTFIQSIQERITKAKDPSVRLVLTTMRDFVVENVVGDVHHDDDDTDTSTTSSATTTSST